MRLIRITNLFLFLAFTFTLEAQVQIKSIQLGYRFSDFYHQSYDFHNMGNNTRSVDVVREAVTEWVNNENYRGHGAAGQNTTFLRNVYLNAEFGGKNGEFWNRNSLQTGVFLSTRMSPGTVMYQTDYQDMGSDNYNYTHYHYYLRNHIRFGGVNLGFNHRFPLVKRYLNFIVGVHTQVGFTLENRYEHDITTHERNTNYSPVSVEKLPEGRGKTYTQWHWSVPFGLEATFSRFSLRAQMHLGILSNQYPYEVNSSHEANGLGVWLGYLLKKPKKK